MAKVAKRRGVYVLDYVDATGIRRTPSYATRPEADDAFKLLVPTRTRRGRRRANADGRITFAAFAEQWLETLGDRKPRTQAGYRWIVATYLEPALGATRVADLTREAIHRALLTLRTSGRRDGGGLAARTVGLAHTVLHTCLEAAVDAKLLAANPATGLAGKKKMRLVPTTKERRQRIALRILSADELVRFERTTAETEPAWLPLLLTYTRAGLRCGEALALDLPDFSDRGGGSLRIRFAVNERTGALEEPKTGPRIVDLSASGGLVEVLRAHAAGLRALGRIPALFPSDEPGGGRVTHRRVARAVARIARRAGLRHCSPHDLRHTYATRLLERDPGCMLYVQRQLGHASIQETIDTYGLTAQPQASALLVGCFAAVGSRVVASENAISVNTARS